MGQISVLVRSRDRRVVTPAELLADPETKKGSLIQAQAEDLADDVRDKLIQLYRGREPWRQTYAEQLPDIEGDWLRPSRWPIESTPEVRLGGTTLTEGLYMVDGRCRHVLSRNPDAESLLAATITGPLATGETSDFRLPSYVAGYVPPGMVGDWEAATAYVVDSSTSYGGAKVSWIEPGGGNALLFRCTASGTSGGSEPTWPAALAEWAPNWVYPATSWVDPLNSALAMEPTTPGTSGDSEPTWPTAAGSTVTDGTATWTARAAMEVTDGTVTWTGLPAKPFPRPIRKGALLIARIIRDIDRNGSCDEHEKRMREAMMALSGAC